MNDGQKIIEHLISLMGKVAVITGGASGIGLGTALRLAEAGAEIALLDINESEGISALEKVMVFNDKSRFFRCDVSSSEECKIAVEKILKEFGKIDILFNNAGIAIRKNTVDLEEVEWDLALNITLKGVYLLSHFVIPPVDYMVNTSKIC